MKTYHTKAENIERNWHLLDAEKQVLGRLSTKITQLLMGKHKVDYSRHADMGDYVVVINSRKVKLTGNKAAQKMYYRHSGYPGGFKKVKYSKMIGEQPEKVIELAVKRMLPDNRLRDKRMRRLKVYAEVDHPHTDRFEKEKEIEKKAK